MVEKSVNKFQEYNLSGTDEDAQVVSMQLRPASIPEAGLNLLQCRRSTFVSKLLYEMF